MPKSCGDGLSLETFLGTMAVAAPSIDIAQFRKRILMRFGTWKAAFAEIAAKYENISPTGGVKNASEMYVQAWELFEQFGAKLDFNREDAIVLFQQLDIDGDGTLTWDEFHERVVESGFGFTIDEFAIRLWTAR